MLVASAAKSSPGQEPQNMERLDDYLRIKEAAEYLGVAPNTLRNWGCDGKIIEHRHPVNNYRLYKKADLDRLLRKAGKSPV